MDHGRIMIMVDIRAMCIININTKINMYVSVSQVPPMEDDVAPDALIEEGTHHVEEDVEDPEGDDDDYEDDEEGTHHVE